MDYKDVNKRADEIAISRERGRQSIQQLIAETFVQARKRLIQANALLARANGLDEDESIKKRKLIDQSKRLVAEVEERVEVITSWAQTGKFIDEVQ